MQISSSPLSNARLFPLTLDAVRVEDGFWRRWQDLNHAISLPHGYAMLEAWGALGNMRVAAGLAQGEFRGYVFQDSDLYKWLEAAALALGARPHTELEARVESVIALLEAAQYPDGYLNSYFTVAKPGQRWTDLEWAHELYCAGHLIEAGIAHKRATGKTNLFEIARRFADHIEATFGTGKRAGLCGHPEIELALVELYRETNDPRYLRLAGYFVDARGHETFQGMRHIGPLYMQDRVPVREAQSVEGHAVRQLYLCAGVTDIYLETGEPALLDAMGRLWGDMTRGKMYLTGGVGARGYGEMFGDAYELPTKEAYCETCAAIAALMWNWRMLLATGETRFADVLERVLYNGFLSGIGMDGRLFFYENPLRSDGTVERKEWYPCACCPPNVMRQLALVGNYCATTNNAGIQLHQFLSGRIVTASSTLNVETRYPWDGKVRITIGEPGFFELALRIPGWVQRGTVKVDGKRHTSRGGTYARFKKEWVAGEIVELTLPMAPRFVESHPYVDATRGAVAIERGPLVYCIEQADQLIDVDDVRLNPNTKLRSVWRDDILNGLMTIEVRGRALDARRRAGDLYRTSTEVKPRMRAAKITAIPYYAWGNRGTEKMRVWIPAV